MFVLMIWSANLNGNVRGNHTTRNFKFLQDAQDAAEWEYHCGNQSVILNSEEEYLDAMYDEACDSNKDWEADYSYLNP